MVLTRLIQVDSEVQKSLNTSTAAKDAPLFSMCHLQDCGGILIEGYPFIQRDCLRSGNPLVR